MLLEKKILALREELEEREAALQVNSTSFTFTPHNKFPPKINYKPVDRTFTLTALAMANPLPKRV